LRKCSGAARTWRCRARPATRESARKAGPARRKGGSRAVSAVVLADCVGCRSRRAAFGPRSQDRGSSSTARVPRGSRAHRANRRWKPDCGGESHQARERRDRWRASRDPTHRRASARGDRGREHSDDGRRPGLPRAASLTGRRRRKTSVVRRRRGRSSDARSAEGSRQRTSETISQARLGANSAHAGGQRAEGSVERPHQDRAPPCS